MDPSQVGSVKRTPASEMFLGEKGKKIVLKNCVIMGDSQQDCVPFAQNRSSQAEKFSPNKGCSLLD